MLPRHPAMLVGLRAKAFHPPVFSRLWRQAGSFTGGTVFLFLLLAAHSQLSRNHLMSLYDEMEALTLKTSLHCVRISNLPALPKTLRHQSTTLTS